MITENQQSLKRVAIVVLASMTLGACSNPNTFPCQRGWLHIRSDGSIQDEYFKKKHSHLTVNEEIVDALTSGYPYSITILYSTLSKSGVELDTFKIATEGKSTVRTASGNDDFFVSSFEIPSNQTAPSDIEAGTTNPSEIVTATVDSRGQLFINGGWPVRLRSVRWCLH